MADLLFQKLGKAYYEARPCYPPELFDFIASKTPCHDLAWDVGTGSGQAAVSLASKFKKVMATDVSQQQLQYATKLPNIRYQHTPPAITSLSQLQHLISPPQSIDLITIAQALHWFDLPTFYRQVNYLLKKQTGVIAAWCYTIAEINETVDAVFHRFNNVDLAPYSDPGRRVVKDKYKSIEFPFVPLEGLDCTGPFEFKAERVMGFDQFLVYVRSMSAYGVAKERGVELLTEDMVDVFQKAWRKEGDGEEDKVVKFPVYLRIGRIGN